LQRAALDVIVLEVGLGGRLDAVNIIDADVAVLTTIDLDHQAWLGSDRESIGYEKAGIFALIYLRFVSMRRRRIRLARMHRYRRVWYPLGSAF